MIGFPLVFFYMGHSLGLDTDLYTVTSSEVPPNVLVILDNSSSMTTADQPPPYNPNCVDVNNCTALPPVYGGISSTDAVYKKEGNDWILWKNSISNITCAQAINPLKIYGVWNGKIKEDGSCGGNRAMSLQTGNYLNYLVLAQTSNQPRLGLAKGVLHSYINGTEGIRFGLMVFNANGQGGKVTANILVPTANGNLTYDKNVVFKALSEINAANVVEWTPLAETLYEAMLYFRGGQSYYNPGITYHSSNYQNPIQYWCQKNYVILITDGAPTHDVADPDENFSHSPIIQGIGDYDRDGKEPGSYGDQILKGSHYLDDVARYIHLNDMSNELTGRQNITTYTIGFNPSQLAIDSTLLQSTAANGGGKFYYCHDANDFSAALQSIIEEVLNKSTTFLAPTVPVSQMVKTESENYMYLGMFKPTEKSFWRGNVKKFGIATTNGTDGTGKNYAIGDVLDKNGNLAIDPQTNAIYDTAVSYWSTGEDGGEVELGGVGEKLKNMGADISKRKIYTYLSLVPGVQDLSNSANAFTTSNTRITPAKLGLATDEEKNNLINFLYGYDVYDEDMNPNTTIRSWILGSVLHSKPIVVHYSSKTVVFVGSNDGMLHAFDDSDGKELWAFIPPDLLSKLKNLTGNTVEFFLDGTPRVHVADDGKMILVCGERRGGNHYFALDITEWEQPKWLWEMHPGLDNYKQMGQTWSTPLSGKIKYGDKLAIFVGGGYDNTNQDNLPATKDNVTGGDAKGFAVYVVDVLNGTRIWKYSITENSKMKYSIPSDISRVDTDGDGRIDRLYVGDMGGQVWRFDIGDPSPANWTGKLIFDSNNPSPPSGVDRRKIFYPPDVSLEKDGGYYELVLFGTGDREHPKDTSLYTNGYFDRLYTIKDRNSGSVLTETNLVNVTENLLQTGTLEQKQSTYNALQNASGWYINLDQNMGEKCLAPALVFFGISYFTTFSPSSEGITDPCFLGEGTARLYEVDYLNGNAVFNLDSYGTINELTRNDRSTVIGTSIPSGIVIAIINGNTITGYGGVSNGIFKPYIGNSKVFFPVSWRQIF